jgi:DNA processing protein
VIERGSASYPARLEELADPPAALHLRAPATPAVLAALLDPPVVAIVGGRRASDTSVAFTRRMARELAAAGVAVVSGLARGIDGAAHLGALDAGGRTVAVLGCGIDRDYPRSNAQLAARIGERGAIISEYAAGVEPAPWRFPARNRLVAAFADVVVVVEASRRSGALITAGCALDLGREVLVVPACPWIDGAAGGNGLIRDGAMPVTGAGDVLIALGRDPALAGGDADPALGDAARRLLEAIRRSPAGTDALAARLGLAPQAVSGLVCELELAGLVVRERDGSLSAV